MTKAAVAKSHSLIEFPDRSLRSYPDGGGGGGSVVYRNVNNEVGYIVQGYPIGSLALSGSSTYRAQAAKADYVLIGAVPPSDFTTEATMVAALRSLRAGCKLLKYTEPRYWYDGVTSASDSPYREAATTIGLNSAPAIWNAKNAAGATLGHIWSPSDTNGINWTSIAATNALGQTLAQAFAAQYQARTQSTIYDGAVMDDSNVVPSGMVVRGSSTEVNWSYLQNGTNYNYLTDYTFGDAWRTGLVAMIDAMRAINSDFLVSINVGLAYYYLQYKTAYSWSAGGRPPSPFSSTALYESVDFAFEENAYAARGFGRKSGSNYTIAGDYATLGEQIWLTFELTRQMTKPAASNRFGARVANANSQMEIGTSTASSSTDIAYARACWAMTKLVEGMAYGNVRNGTQPMFIDETCIKLGTVVAGPRSMGTLNEPPNGDNTPTSFTVRTQNATNGSAKFWWAEFSDAIVVWRGDNTGITPGSGNFGDGSAVACTLPSAGTGYRWDEYNAATYVHPDFADLAMIGQDTSLNSGATGITSVSLKPLHGKALRRVSTGGGSEVAPAFRAASSAATNNTAETVATVTKPAGTASGDLLILAAQVTNNSGSGSWGSVTWPAGFTQQASAEADPVGWNKLLVATKVAGGSEPSTYAVTYTETGGPYRVIAAAAAYSDPNSTPLDVAAVSQNNSSNAGTAQAPSLTPSNANSKRLVTIYGISDGNATTDGRSLAPPGSQTERVEVVAGSGDGAPYSRLMIADEVYTSASATGTRSATISGGDCESMAISLLLRGKVP